MKPLFDKLFDEATSILSEARDKVSSDTQDRMLYILRAMREEQVELSKRTHRVFKSEYVSISVTSPAGSSVDAVLTNNTSFKMVIDRIIITPEDVGQDWQFRMITSTKTYAVVLNVEGFTTYNHELYDNELTLNPSEYLNCFSWLKSMIDDSGAPTKSVSLNISYHLEDQ